MIKSTFIIAVLLLHGLSGFSAAPAKKTAPVQQTTKATVVNLISALPEVKKYMQQNKNLHPVVMLYREPGTDLAYYWVQVGISNADKFWPSYNFYIEPKTGKIYYKDMVTNGVDPKNALITLQQWRQYRSTTGFMKMHTYKNGKLVVMNGQ